MIEIKKSLLPQGFHDHLSPTAEHEMKLNSVVVKQLKLFGYDLVRPALMEFEESLDRDFSSDFFKVTDTISGKMMVIRNDITPQIARIVKDRFGQDALNSTIRLAYTGQVVKKTGKRKMTERQLTQTGFELISENSAKRDAEILYIAIETFQKAGISDFTIDLCYPKLASVLLKDFSEQQQKIILKAIEEKDIPALEIDFQNSDIVKIIKTLDKASNPKNSIEVLEQLEKEISNIEAVKIFNRTKEVLEILVKSSPNLNISLNLLEIMGFEYHNGLCFSFISRQKFEEIGRGGRYKISIANQSVSASGFTFLINSMLKCVEIQNSYEKKLVSYEEGFISSKNLRENNIITIFE